MNQGIITFNDDSGNNAQSSQTTTQSATTNTKTNTTTTTNTSSSSYSPSSSPNTDNGKDNAAHPVNSLHFQYSNNDNSATSRATPSITTTTTNTTTATTATVATLSSTSTSASSTSSSPSPKASEPVFRSLSSPHSKKSNLVDRVNNKGKTKAVDSEITTNRPQAVFVNKLYKMLEDPSIQDLINWSQNGDLFSVANPTAFSKLVLPQYFKHNNWQSFVRQLNMYGFHKVNDMIHSNLTSECQKWEFRHQHFRRGAVEELQNIKRKSAKSHHQYLSSSLATSSVPASSMGRLLLGNHPSLHHASNQGTQLQQHLEGSQQRQLQHQNQHQHEQQKLRINNNDSLLQNEPDNNSNVTVKSDPSNTIYHHILRLEDRIRIISQSHISLKNETDHLRIILARQQAAMQEITDMLLTIAKQDNTDIHVEKVMKLKRCIEELRASRQASVDIKDGSPTGSEHLLVKEGLTSASTSATDINTLGNKNTHPSISVASKRIYRKEDHGHDTINVNIRGKSNDTDNEREIKSSGHDTSSNNDNNSSNSNTDYSNYKKGATHRPSDTFLPMPISSIFEQEDNMQILSPTSEEMNANRLPSIEVVHRNSLPSTSSHRRHHHAHHHHPYSAATGSSLSPKASFADHGRPGPSLHTLQPIRSLLDTADLRPISTNSNKVTNMDATTVSTLPESKAPSPYMGLGKESPLMNPGPVDMRQPTYDYNGISETKRRRTDDQQ